MTSVFEGLVQINSEGEFVYNKWVEWYHFGVPSKSNSLRTMVRYFLAFLGHCLICTNLDGCYFVERNMPEQPLHENCDCNKKFLTFEKLKMNATAECDIRKFTEYVFKDTKDSRGKNQIFYNLGYNIEDADYLQQEFCRQALESYLLGNYKLKNLDIKGQRVAIPITLKSITFYSGWMIYPNGLIKNTTPFGGWIK